MALFTRINSRHFMIGGFALALAGSAGLSLRAQEVKPPQILRILPEIAYSNEDIHIQGMDFGNDPSAISLQVDGRPINLKDCGSTNALTKAQQQTGQDAASNPVGAICATFHLDTIPNQIDLTHITGGQMEQLSGNCILEVKGTDGVTRASQPDDKIRIRWSSLTQAQVTQVSLGGGLILGAVLLLLVGLGTRQMIDTGVRGGIITTFLLDPQTNTLSLSKFQFYVWTVAAISSYNYLLVSTLLVQKAGTLPDVPTNLPWIFASSIGTSIGISAITMARGPKGAGEVRPRLSDLITMGGVVVPDRVQYLVWTIVGATGYMLTIHALDPRDLSKLPPIPTTLLALGGVSAAGYVGGRLAKKVGPVVDTADLSIAGANAAASKTGTQPAPPIAPAMPPGPVASVPRPASGTALLLTSAPLGISTIQKSLTTSSQGLTSLVSNNPNVTNAIQMVQASIAKAAPLTQFLSSAQLDPRSLATLPPLLGDALKSAEVGSRSVANLAQSNPPDGNMTEQNALQSAAQTVDQVLHQFQLLSDLANQLAPPATSQGSGDARPPETSTSPVQAPVDATTMWTLTMKGRGLSRDATFSLADALTPAMEIALVIPPFIPVGGSASIPLNELTASNGEANPEIIEEDTDSGSSELAKVLRVRFQSAALATKAGKAGRLNFKISNPDGQMAVFPVEKPRL